MGLTRAALARRTASATGTWQGVLPRVYAAFPQQLSAWHRCCAAQLYAGGASLVTGLAALRLLGVRHLPASTIVDVLVPRQTYHGSRSFVRIERTSRMPYPRIVEGLRITPAGRAAVDAARRLTSYDDTLAIATGVVQRELTTVGELTAEVQAAPRRGTAVIRRVLWAVSDGARSVAEADALRLFRAAGLPEPLVNHGLVVPGESVRCPDFRWGRLIVEIDSKEWHLLVPGSWEATQARRKALERRGYIVLVVTPSELAGEPEQVVADIRARLTPEAA